QVLDDGHRGMSVWASANRFAEDVADVLARFSRIDVRNRFERLGVGADAGIQGARSRLAFGFSAAWRSIGNRIVPLSGEDFPATDAAFRRVELGVYAEITKTLGRASLQAGTRLDAAGETRVWQPRARVALPVATRCAPAVGIGRAVVRPARLANWVGPVVAGPPAHGPRSWAHALGESLGRVRDVRGSGRCSPDPGRGGSFRRAPGRGRQ